MHFDALWKPFGCLLHDFLVPFNTFCPPRPNFSGPRDDTGHISGPGRKKLRKSCKVAELWPPLGSPICDHFGKVDDFLAACFLLIFLGAQFAHKLQVRGPSWVQFAMLFGIPGTFGNRLKTLKGIRFSHSGDAFCRYGFQAGSGGGLFVDFHAF